MWYYNERYWRLILAHFVHEYRTLSLADTYLVPQAFMYLSTKYVERRQRDRCWSKLSWCSFFTCTLAWLDLSALVDEDLIKSSRRPRLIICILPMIVLWRQTCKCTAVILFFDAIQFTHVNYEMHSELHTLPQQLHKSSSALSNVSKKDVRASNESCNNLRQNTAAYILADISLV